MAEQAVMANRTALITMLLGTNDNGEMATNAIAYLDRQISQFWSPVRATHNGNRLYLAPWNEIARYSAGWNGSVESYISSMNVRIGGIFNDVVNSQSSVCGIYNIDNVENFFQENPNYVHPNSAGNNDFVYLIDNLVTNYRDWKSTL